MLYNLIHKKSKSSSLDSTLVLVKKKQLLLVQRWIKGIAKAFHNELNIRSQSLPWTNCFIFFSYSFPAHASLNSCHNPPLFQSKPSPPSRRDYSTISSAKWVLISPQTTPLSGAFLAFPYCCWHRSSLICFIHPPNLIISVWRQELCFTSIL